MKKSAANLEFKRSVIFVSLLMLMSMFLYGSPVIGFERPLRVSLLIRTGRKLVIAALFVLKKL